MTTIPLHQPPSIRDFHVLRAKATEPCFCTREMAEDLAIDTNPTTCLPCACRFALNAIATVAQQVRKELK